MRTMRPLPNRSRARDPWGSVASRRKPTTPIFPTIDLDSLLDAIEAEAAKRAVSEALARVREQVEKHSKTGSKGHEEMRHAVLDILDAAESSPSSTRV